VKESWSEGQVLVPLLSAVRPVFDLQFAVSCTRARTRFPNYLSVF
jgi:hypothetical protein